jgi:regulator of protease activity HflC (stomatin/prohibitin superfamily)
MIGFIFIMLAIVLGAVLIGKRKVVNDGLEVNHGAGIVGGVFLVAGLIFLALSMFVVVPPKNVGIPVALGRPSGHSVDNGLHVVAPWTSVENVDATIKTVTLDANLGEWNGNHCTSVTVRLANQTTACLDVTLQWRLDPNVDITQLWKDYRGKNDDLVGNLQNVVVRELRRSANEVFATYNPLSVLNPNNDVPKQTAEQLNTEVLNGLRGFLPGGVHVDTVFISVVHYDATTQQKLNGYAQALADTQIATQQKLTAQQQKLANDQLAVSSSNDPGVMYQNCLNLLKDLAAKGQLVGLPPTFNCGGGNTPVIVGGK